MTKWRVVDRFNVLLEMFLTWEIQRFTWYLRFIGILQQFSDEIKLFLKEHCIPPMSNYIFIL